MFNDTPAQKIKSAIGCAKNYIYIKKLKSNMYILKIPKVINTVKSCAKNSLSLIYKLKLIIKLTLLKIVMYYIYIFYCLKWDLKSVYICTFL